MSISDLDNLLLFTPKPPVAEGKATSAFVESSHLLFFPQLDDLVRPEPLASKRLLKQALAALDTKCDLETFKILKVNRFHKSDSTHAYSLSCLVRLGDGRQYLFTADKKPGSLRTWGEGGRRYRLPQERFSLQYQPSILEKLLPVLGIPEVHASAGTQHLSLTLMDTSCLTENSRQAHVVLEGQLEDQSVLVRELPTGTMRFSRTTGAAFGFFLRLKQAAENLAPAPSDV